jgi:predicted metal-binding membrane protein
MSGAARSGATRSDAALERLVRRDRLVVAAGVLGVSALAWAHIAAMAAHGDGMGDGMGAMDAGMAMPQPAAWAGRELALLFAMWAVMMVAMMLPSAAPLVLLFAAIARRRRERQSPAAPTTALAAGYLLAWTAFSAAAAVAQWGLHQAALLSPAMASTSPALGGALLVAAGLYQWTPLKGRCLAECRSPLGFLAREWREGVRGAVVMGARHGAFCVGCCWVLMALLFVAGVMNLLWIAVLSAFVLIEKVAPAGGWLGRAAGLLLVAWGGWMVLQLTRG